MTCTELSLTLAASVFEDEVLTCVDGVNGVSVTIAPRPAVCGAVHARQSHFLINSFICICSNTFSSAFAHCAPDEATAGTPMPAVVESPQR